MSVLLIPIADKHSRDAACNQFMKTLMTWGKKSPLVHRKVMSVASLAGATVICLD